MEQRCVECEVRRLVSTRRGLWIADRPQDLLKFFPDQFGVPFYFQSIHLVQGEVDTLCWIYATPWRVNAQPVMNCQQTKRYSRINTVFALMASWNTHLCLNNLLRSALGHWVTVSFVKRQRSPWQSMQDWEPFSAFCVEIARDWKQSNNFTSKKRLHIAFPPYSTLTALTGRALRNIHDLWFRGLVALGFGMHLVTARSQKTPVVAVRSRRHNVGDVCDHNRSSRNRLSCWGVANESFQATSYLGKNRTKLHGREEKDCWSCAAMLDLQCCDWQVRKASQCDSKKQERTHTLITLFLLVCAKYIRVLFYAHIPFVVNCAFNADREVATTARKRLRSRSQSTVSRAHLMVCLAVTTGPLHRSCSTYKADKISNAVIEGL